MHPERSSWHSRVSPLRPQTLTKSRDRLQCFGLLRCHSGDFALLSSHPGGGSGIGRAVCQRFASEGASVVVADISEESANETLGSLQNDLRGQGHMAAVVDVSSKESVKKLVTSIQVCNADRETPQRTHTVSSKVF